MVQYVLLLPRFFNDGREVPVDLFFQTYEELIDQFGGISVDPHDVTGYWTHEGRRYKDLSRRVIVSGEDTAENAAFIRRLKEVLKERFEQIDIWITAQQVDVI